MNWARVTQADWGESATSEFWIDYPRDRHDFVRLIGPCPRCKDEIVKPLDAPWRQGRIARLRHRRPPVVTKILLFQCGCGGSHDDVPEGKYPGCGAYWKSRVPLPPPGAGQS